MHNSMAIDEILNKEDGTIEMLMDEEDIIPEFRNMNSKLIDL